MTFPTEYLFDGHLRWNLGSSNPNYAGAFLAMLFPWCWAMAMRAGRMADRKKRRMAVCITVLLEWTLWLLLSKTYSRGGLLSALAAGAVMFAPSVPSVRTKKAGMEIGVRVALVVSALLITGFYGRIGPRYLSNDSSISNRLILWKASLKMIAAAPLSGWGSGESGSAFMNWFQPIGRTERYTTTVNSYLHVAVEHGLIVLSLAIAGIWLVAIRPIDQSAGSWPSILRQRSRTCAARASLVAWLCANLFTTLWIDPYLWALPALAGAICLGDLRRLKTVDLIRHLVLAMAAGGTGAAALCATGFALARKSPLRIERDATGAVKLEHNRILSADKMKRFDVWIDREVLGPLPGQELRIWYEALPSDSMIVAHFPQDTSTIVDRHGIVVLFGRQVERLKRIVDTNGGIGQILVVHPILDSARPIPDRPIPMPIAILLPEIDQMGQRPFWLSASRRIGGSLKFSANVANDIRPAWPEALEPILPFQHSPKRSEIDRVSRGRQADSLSPLSVRPPTLPQPTFHRVTSRGVLKREYSLVREGILENLGIRCSIEHAIIADAYADPHSTWIVPSLRSWIAPDGHDYLVWQPLGRPQIRFSKSSVGSEYKRLFPLLISARSQRDGQFDIISEDHVVWTYRDGLLTSITDLSGPSYNVETQGGLIRRIHANERGGLADLIADYDDFGHLMHLRDGLGEIHLRWIDGEVTELIRKQHRAIRIDYRLGLVDRIVEDGRGPEVFTWAKGPDRSTRPNSWPGRAYITSDSEFDYQYYIACSGNMIQAIRRDTGKKDEIVYNRLRSDAFTAPE